MLNGWLGSSTEPYNLQFEARIAQRQSLVKQFMNASLISDHDRIAEDG
jgi:hypothetical protein